MVVIKNKIKKEKAAAEEEDEPFDLGPVDSRGMLRLDIHQPPISKCQLSELYQVDNGSPFATGLYAQVKRCMGLRREEAGQYFAAKFSPRKRPGQSKDGDCVESLHEIALLSRLKHPCIISFMSAFVLDDCVVTVMELAPGGDLQTVIDADLVLLEKDASRYVHQLLEALKYLHRRHIAHLDIKPQNLLLMGEFPNCDIKLCDFEISRVIQPGKEVKEILGTPDYVAPEILLYEPLSTSADMWSVGILTYVLLTGFSPFGGDTDQETFRNIVHEPIDFPDELFEDVSGAAIDFIIRLAVKNSKLRPTPSEIEKHGWIKSFLAEGSEESTPPSQTISSPQELEVTNHHPEPPASSSDINFSFNQYDYCGPKKRSPRKTHGVSGSIAASVGGRSPSARCILRACKSSYDLSKMGGKTKSREALIQKMKTAAGDSSVGGSWKLRKNLSKSREQLWQSKVQLSKSCEKISQSLSGSTRWASVANFPSLDQGALLRSTNSQESVTSVVSVSNCTGCRGSNNWLADSSTDALFDQPCDTNTPINSPPPVTGPVPNFDLSSPVSNVQMLDTGIPTTDTDTQETLPGLCNSVVEQESQKSVAELIVTFGGRNGNSPATGNASANNLINASNNNSSNGNKKFALKNSFEPILESEEQPVSIGDEVNNGHHHNNGFSKTANPNNNESGIFSMNSDHLSLEDTSSCLKHRGLDDNWNNRRHSKTSQQLRDELRYRNQLNRRGSLSSHPLRSSEMVGDLKGILKKTPPLNGSMGTNGHILNGNASVRRGSIPGTCTRLYDTHTISSLAKVPKKSILKNPNNNGSNNHNHSHQPRHYGGSSGTGTNCNADSHSSRKHGNRGQDVAGTDCESKENENAVGSEDVQTSSKTNNTHQTTKSGTKKIPKGFSPREQPSFILLDDEKSTKTVQRRKPVVTRPSSITPTNITSKGMRKPSKSSQNSTSSTNTNNKSPGITPICSSSKPNCRRSTVLTQSQETSKKACSPTRSTPQRKSSIRHEILKTTKGKKMNNPQDIPVDIRVAKCRSSTSAAPDKKLSSNYGSDGNTTGGKSSSSSNNSHHAINSSNSSQHVSNVKVTSKFKTELSIEPAAVAIKVFPPDPVIMPKSPVLIKPHPTYNFDATTSAKANSSDTNDNSDTNGHRRLSKEKLKTETSETSQLSGSFPDVGQNRSEEASGHWSHPESSTDLDTLNVPHGQDHIVGVTGCRSPNMKHRRCFRADRKVRDEERSAWGVVCTGSIGRAMERFENGSIKGKKLRRGSVPDF